ncbi:MAG: HAMP domain-containing histidine kinase [Nitrospirae bacterium]|nr:HAMP domain-containing histidine kinase [Nitrospirota bacterium]
MAGLDEIKLEERGRLEREQLRVRFVVITAVAVYAYANLGAPVPGSTAYYTSFIFGAYFACLAFIRLSIHFGWFPRSRVYIGLTFDNIIITFGILVSGGTDSAFYVFYYLVGFGTGFRYGQTAMIASLIQATVGYSAVIAYDFLAAVGPARPQISMELIKILAMWGLTYYVTVLIQKLRKKEQNILELARRVQKLEDPGVDPTSVYFSTGDEIEVLAGTFNALTDSLKRREEALTRQNEELRRMADELRKSLALKEENVELRLLTEELNRQKDLAVHATQAKTKFLATMSHELRTPLTSIRWSAENILAGVGGAISPKQQDYLKAQIRTTDHLIRLVNELLDLSRIEEGRIVLNRTRQAVWEIVRDAMTDVQGIAEQRGIQIAGGPSDGSERMEVSVDRDRILQVLVNLLHNAIKHSSAGSRVTIDAVARSYECRIDVADEGGGISAEFLPHIFDPFTQAETVKEGAGLGLAIAKNLVELHGGRLTAESAVGVGSRFSVYLPMGG